MGTPTKITFRFKKDGDYRLIPVNGVWGGTTLRGDVMVSLFHESQSLPEAVTHEVTPDDKLGKELKRTPPPIEFQRTLLVGMVLTAEQADSIGLWLQKQAREAGERTKTEGGGDSERDTFKTN